MTEEQPEIVPCPLWQAAQTWPKSAALITHEQSYSYAELNSIVDERAEAFRAEGIEAGMVIGLYFHNKAAAVIAILALLRRGAIAAPLSTREPIQEEHPLLQKIYTDQSETTTKPGSACIPPIIEAAVATVPAFTQSRWGMSTPATLIHTSGSTGMPKQALHTLGNHYFNALGSNANIRLNAGDRWLLSLPLYHVGGMAIIFRTLLAGATMVVPAPMASLAETLRQHAITHVSMVATQLQRLVQQEVAFESLKAILLGGSAIPPSLLDAAWERKLPVHTTYGLTEMASQVTTTAPGATRNDLRSSGRVLPYREVQISAQGEVLVRGATCFAGYLGDDGTLISPTDAAGWFHTGDLGYLDEVGNLHIQGRIDNMFISGGENIYPEEIERALCRLKNVLQAVVVPVPNSEFGERPVAFLRTSPDAVTPEQLHQHLAALLPTFKIPDGYYEWPVDIPEQMKLNRQAFKQRAKQIGNKNNGTSKI